MFKWFAGRFLCLTCLHAAMAERDIGGALVGLGFGAYFFVRGLRWWKWKRLIENTPTSKVRGLAMGHAEVYGKVARALKQLFKSPFTGKDCVYYRYEIEELRSDNKGRSRWVTIRSGTAGTPFYLDDGTGKVLVDTQGADIEIPSDYQLRTSAFSQVPAGIVKFCEKQNLSVKSWFFGMNKTLRFTEYYVAPSDKLYVMGSAGDNPYVEEATAQKSAEDIMIQKGKHPPFYYISDKHEHEVLRKLKWRVYGGMLGGGALLLACLGYLFWVFGAL